MQTMASADNFDRRRSSRPRAREHLETYQLFRIVNEYAPFHLPARVLENAPTLPDPLDAAVDSGLTAVDNFVEARAASVRRSYDRWVLRPRENIRTGVGVYTEWGKGLVAGNLRKLEEGIFVMGNYLLPSEDEEEGEEEDHEHDHEHAVMNSYWTSTESVIDTSDEEDYLGTSRIVSKDGKLRPLTPTAGYHHHNHPHHQRNHSHQHHHHHNHSHSDNRTRQRSASTPSLPPFQPDQPSKEVENIGRLLVTFAHRTYVRNAHKTPGQMLYDALDLARAEAKRVVKGFDEKYSIEIGYLQKMMEVGR
ncbi:hypothetical protein TWF481_008574 [Arthrobotrys musiformis]|uniref:Uncharacterized protein n=1 Tax=Arthrobotrys musiformis TaxID=47236 RepID=A0AAV9W9Z4_9PEZI